METNYCEFYSENLSRTMPMKVWGHAGRPILFIPCQDGRFFDFENFGMADAWSPYLESGRATVFFLNERECRQCPRRSMFRIASRKEDSSAGEP